MKSAKKIILIGASVYFIFLFFILMMFFGIASSEEEETASSSSGNRFQETSMMKNMVRTAEDELQLVNGAKGGDKYRKWYTGRVDNLPWCATFISYIANRAGVPTDVIPKFQDCDAGVKWFKQNGNFYYTKSYGSSSTYFPRMGDLIFFTRNMNKNDSTHVGLVVNVDTEKVYTIEGNSSNTVKARSYALDNSKILGYAHPHYFSNDNNFIYTQGSLSDAFKFFAMNESGANYNRGFSSGDSYHALGYYQFDNRYTLQEFLGYCYMIDSKTYKPFKQFLNVAKSSLANNKKLEQAWHNVYNKDPDGFARLQDNFEYAEYYVPCENSLRNKGINLSNRHDAVKGMVCSISNLFGSEQASIIISESGVTNKMNDKTFVKKVYDYLYSWDYDDYVAHGKKGKKYFNGWHARWKREKEQCLKFL